MLIIRQSQMDILQEHAEEDFVRRVMAHLREKQDAETYQLNDQQLRERVKFGIEKARGYDLTWEEPIAFFVQLMFAVSPIFDEQENIRDILDAPYDEPNEKMDYLVKYTTDEDWDEAANLDLEIY